MIKISNLTVSYRSREGTIRAIEDLTLDIPDGEIFGIVGESGSGKSTLAMTLIGLLPKNGYVESGTIEVDGKDLLSLPASTRRRMRGKEISLVFQGAMNTLNPLLKIEDQVAEPLLIHKVSTREEAVNKARDTLLKVGLDSGTWKKFPHELSGGMKQRAVIATALVLNPGVIIADEPSTALDVITQVQIMNVIREIRRSLGITVILISHDFPLVSEMADRILILYGGKPAEVGKNAEVLESSGHPYTRGLIGSVPSLDDGRRLIAIPGEPVNLKHPHDGCRFYSRCSIAGEECKRYRYEPVRVSADHLVYCVKYGGDLNG